jgi:predicted NAD/FAD-dependent oxidoreductase
MPLKSLHVAVIGAGMAGLAAARALQEAGCRVVVFEKNSVPGGRVATRQMSLSSTRDAASVLLDYGAQNIKADGTALGCAAQNLFSEQNFAIVHAPVCVHHQSRILAGDSRSNAERKWSCVGGMQQLPRALAGVLDMRYDVDVQRIDETNGFTLHGHEGPIYDVAQRVVMTAPAPLAAELLQASNWRNEAAHMDERIALLNSVEYSRCITVMLHFAAPGEHIPWYALLARDRSHPLLWLARENAKGFVPDGQGCALVAQLGHEASCALWDEADATIAQRTTQWIMEILGSDFSDSLQHEVYRWRYSQPRNTIDFEAVNPPGTRVLICGDATARGRVTDAYDSGLKAAARILQDHA